MPLISPADKTNIAPQCQVKRSGCVILILKYEWWLKAGTGCVMQTPYEKDK